MSLGANDGAITPKPPNIFVMWDGETSALAAVRNAGVPRYSSSAASSDAFPPAAAVLTVTTCSAANRLR